MIAAMPEKTVISDYVQDGLVLAYDGYQAPSGGVWRDLSPSHNDMSMGSGASYDADYKCVLFTVGSTYTSSDCSTAKTVAWASAVTFEFIYAIESGSAGLVLRGSTTWPFKPYINFGNFLNLYLPEVCKTPWLVGCCSSTDHSKAYLHQYAIESAAYRYKQWANSKFSEGSGSCTDAITGGSNVLYMGGAGARIYALRIYNRALTDAELEQNRTLDIARFNI